MKSSNNSTSDDMSKSTTQSKNSKKSTKSRSKSTKSESSSSKTSSATAAAGVNSIPVTPANSNIVTTPTTPTTSTSNYNFFDASFAGAGNSTETQSSSSSSKSHHKSYAGLEPRSVKIMWEQHDQTDLELSQEVCARVAEDASYKLWEIINNVKTYARHSGGCVTYDLVNEVLTDADVPPALGAMDTDWERIDYDGSYFFHADKILELREEYQKEVNFSLPDGPDFICTCPLEDKHLPTLKQYIPNLIFAAIYCDTKTRNTALTEAATTTLMGVCYRVIVSKIVHILAFKQQDSVSQRCWRLLRACNANPYANYVHCREEYLHLAEILICQLLAPFETIKTHETKSEQPETTVKMEVDESKPEEHNDIVKPEQYIAQDAEQAGTSSEFANANAATAQADGEKATKMQLVEDDDDVEMLLQAPQQMSPYFACPVGAACVDELCECIGHLAAQSGHLLGECLFLIKRRLTRFFESREVGTPRDYSYLSRAVRGLIALGEYAFREFIPYIFKLKVDDIPDSLWQDFAVAAVFLNGADDIFLYEWLEYGCGGNKLQPFMVHLALEHEKHLIRVYLRPKSNIYKICSEPGIRRLEWSTLAAAMCHGDDPTKALKPKPTLHDVFPDLTTPNLQLNRSGNIRFKFAGCRPVLLKPKSSADEAHGGKSPSTNGANEVMHSDIVIARRILFKPLSNLRTAVPLCSFYYTKIN